MSIIAPSVSYVCMAVCSYCSLHVSAVLAMTST